VDLYFNNAKVVGEGEREERRREWKVPGAAGS
jgi:hypothetical protein